MENDEKCCRICFESGGELISPCFCTGSMKYVHSTCLDEWRISSFDPQTLSSCVLCRAKFCVELKGSTNGIGASNEVWVEIVRYIGLRFAMFLGVVTVLGFAPDYVAGDLTTGHRLFQSPVVNHLSLGTISALGLAGMYSFVQIICSASTLRILFDPFRSWGILGTRGSRRGQQSELYCVLFVVLGLLYLLYHLSKDLWHICTAGRHAALENLKHTNRKMRERIVRRYKVVDYIHKPEEEVKRGANDDSSHASLASYDSSQVEMILKPASFQLPMKEEESVLE